MALVIVAKDRERRDEGTVPVLPPLASASAPPPTWQSLEPVAVYALDLPELKGLASARASRRDASGVREDTLTFGTFEDEARPHLRLIVRRSPGPESLAPSLFVDLARRSSEAPGLALTRSTPSVGISTKFGIVEAADVVVSGGSDRACLGFRFTRADAGFGLTGWLCGTGGQAADRRQLACALDRLSLVNPGAEPALQTVFAAADRQRIEGCAPPQVAAVPVKPAALSRTAGRRR